MALLVDGSSPSAEELARYEAAAAETARTEGIDLASKSATARDEVTTELCEVIRRTSMGASDTDWTRHVVLTEPLRRWLVLRTLMGLYQEARHGQVSDRYRQKWEDYRRLSEEAKSALLATGIGLVWNPLLKGGAPAVEATSPGALTNSYFVRTTWVDATGEESEASDGAAFQPTSAGAMSVRVTDWPAGATGWNIYAGDVESRVAVQNDAPLQLDAEWTQTTAPRAGRPPGLGQEPDVYLYVPNALMRG